MDTSDETIDPKPVIGLRGYEAACIIRFQYAPILFLQNKVISILCGQPIKASAQQNKNGYYPLHGIRNFNC
jgi:hypothetical protein